MLRASTSAALSRPLATALWAVAGFVFYAVGGLASLLALAALERLLPPDARPVAGSIGLSIRNGLHLVAWAALTAGASMVAGRRLVTGLRFGFASWSLLALGTALAAFTMFMVNEDVRARFGYFDPEYAHVSFFTGPAVLAIALATWATLAAPRGQGIVLAGAAAAGAAALGISLLPSLPAATDGIDADHVPLAVTFVADMGYTAVAIAAVVARLLRPAPEPERRPPG